MYKHKIVAVVGMCGSGKTVAVDIFEKQGWHKIYFGAATLRKMKELNLEINEENEIRVREMLRESGDKGVYAKLYLKELDAAIKKGNVVIEDLYSWSDYKIVKEHFGDAFEVLCIATDGAVRRERLKIRAFRPMGEEECRKRDYIEIEKCERGGLIGIADHYFLNNSSVSALKQNVLKYINKIQK